MVLIGRREGVVGDTSDSGVSNVQNATSTDSGTPRPIRRRPHLRPDSVGSLDQLYDTRHDHEAARPKTVSKGQETQSTTTNTYGVAELRDNFFDPYFSLPEEVDLDDLMRQAEQTLPLMFRKKDPLSPRHFFPKQWYDVKIVFQRVTRTRAGIKLLKSFLAFFIAYILCLVPSVQAWLGRYNYIMVISVIINHSGRTMGAQIEGAIATVLGTATGLGWGAFGLWLSTASASARLGYGGILAMFLCIYIFIIACLRSYYIRTYQLVICAGISICYTCLAEVSGNQVSWSKLLAFGVPWAMGQAIALIPCVLIAPDAGARPLAVALHGAFAVMLVRLQQYSKPLEIFY
jgi:hypothetical protein